MRIGDLRKRITFESEVKTADGMGGFTESYEPETTVWASIWPVSAAEQIQANQNVMTITHRIRIRYRDDISSHWRIKYRDRYFSIVAIINPSERNVMLELLCREATA